MLPGQQLVNEIIPSPPRQGYLFWNILSPEKSLPKAFPRPPFVVVSITILGVIQLIPQPSVIICSPSCKWQITAGNGVPLISYCINLLLTFLNYITDNKPISIILSIKLQKYNIIYILFNQYV